LLQALKFITFQNFYSFKEDIKYFFYLTGLRRFSSHGSSAKLAQEAADGPLPRNRIGFYLGQPSEPAAAAMAAASDD
jgi:hypothetical protein